MKDDTISRRAAIDELERGKDKKAKGAVGGFYNQIIDNDIEKLRRLPSAQPFVLTCDGCRFVGTYDTDFPCSGCIRREKDYYEQER